MPRSGLGRRHHAALVRKTSDHEGGKRKPSWSQRNPLAGTQYVFLGVVPGKAERGKWQALREREMEADTAHGCLTHKQKVSVGERRKLLSFHLIQKQAEPRGLAPAVSNSSPITEGEK